MGGGGRVPGGRHLRRSRVLHDQRYEPARLSAAILHEDVLPEAPVACGQGAGVGESCLLPAVRIVPIRVRHAGRRRFVRARGFREALPRG